jgi:hypothetical protein
MLGISISVAVAKQEEKLTPTSTPNLYPGAIGIASLFDSQKINHFVELPTWILPLDNESSFR